MKREEALKLLDQKLQNKNLIKHSLAVEAVMRTMAVKYDGDVEIWGLAGLLHDLDYEETASDWTKHGILTEEWLADYDLPAKVFAIIRAHNADGLGIKCNTIAENAIYAIDPITCLITAAALMNPERKISNLEASSVLKKFKNLKFAAGANREHIKSCEDFGLPLEEFIAISLKAMQGIDRELGL